MANERWPPEWQRGFLDFLILNAVAAEGEPTYGYRIVQHLDGAGFGKIKGGTLYPILAKLEAAGFIHSRWGEGEGGPGRKFVEITVAGRAHLHRLTTGWQEFDQTVTRLVGMAAEGERA